MSTANQECAAGALLPAVSPRPWSHTVSQREMSRELSHTLMRKCYTPTSARIQPLRTLLRTGSPKVADLQRSSQTTREDAVTSLKQLLRAPELCGVGRESCDQVLVIQMPLTSLTGASQDPPSPELSPARYFAHEHTPAVSCPKDHTPILILHPRASLDSVKLTAEAGSLSLHPL